MEYKEFSREAKKLVQRYAAPFIRKKMLGDNEMLGAIISAMANAELQYDPNHPKKASLNTYRNKCAIFAIKVETDRYVRDLKQKKKGRKYWLYGNEIFDNMCGPDPLKSYEDNEYIDNLLKQIEPELAELIYDKYYNRQTLKQLSSKYNLSHEGIRLKINKGLEQLRHIVKS